MRRNVTIDWTLKENVRAKLRVLAEGLPLHSENMPKVAWDALEAGFDGPAIRRLAALDSPGSFQVAQVLPRAMQELGILRIPETEAAERLCKARAQQILLSGDDPIKHLWEFESFWIRADYADSVSSLGTLDDEVGIAQSSGESNAEIRIWVTSRLSDFIHSHR